MRKKQLGRTDLIVTEICLGTMTWGSMNTEAEGHAQIDFALEQGCNFMDTAEMYPVSPVLKETVGNTEKIIGNWFEKTGKRDDWILASKIAGPNGGFARDGAAISSGEFVKALDSSLTRLKTDRIDLYQLHWPNRGSYAFRQNWTYDPSSQKREETMAHMRDVLAEAQRQVEAGKIRYLALSNESAWGMTSWARLAEEMGAPRVASVQNEYSLLYRLFDTDAAEASWNEDIPLLAWSPLAAGILGGRYRDGSIPEDSRAARTPGLGGRMTERSKAAVEAYAAVAEKHGLSLPVMAIAWCMTRPFVGSTIIGASKMPQLAECLSADQVTLAEECLADIDAVHMLHPMPY